LKKLSKEFLKKVTISLFKNYLGKETRWYQKVGAILSVGSSLISTYNSIFGEPQYEEWIVY